MLLFGFVLSGAGIVEDEASLPEMLPLVSPSMHSAEDVLGFTTAVGSLVTEAGFALLAGVAFSLVTGFEFSLSEVAGILPASFSSRKAAALAFLFSFDRLFLSFQRSFLLNSTFEAVLSTFSGSFTFAPSRPLGKSRGTMSLSFAGCVASMPWSLTRTISTALTF